MNKYTLVTIFFVFLLISAIPIALAHNPTTNKSVLVIDTIGEPETLDPAWAYDTASGDVIQNVYEGLITYQRDYEDGPYTEGKIDLFEPVLATAVPSMQTISEVDPDTGVEWVQRMTFTIKTGIKFHDLTTVTPADVEYSFERVMVQDRDGGPQWMLYFPLLTMYGADMSDVVDMGEMIDHSVESDATTVWFNFATAFPELTWKQILSQTWGSVVKKSWAITNGDWDGTWANWDDWHNPAVSEIEGNGMMGTGPYKFTDWTSGASYQIDRFTQYWDGWPLRIQSGSNLRLPGYIDTIIEYYKPTWTDRRARFLAGTSDFTAVPREFRDQVLGQPDVTCYYPFDTLANTAAFYTFNLTTTTPYLGNTFDPNNAYGINPASWGNTRTPADLWTDINVRKGFSYAFDYNGWLTASYLGEGNQPSSPIVSGLPYYNPANNVYKYNTTEATYYLKLAWGGTGANPGHNPALVTPGKLWNNGMQFTILYNTGNVARQTAAETWTANIKSLNPLFNLNPAQGVAWGSIYLPAMVNGELPIFIIGWLADYADPDNFAFPFMHSQGTFSAWQKYNNPRVDALITLGATTNDDAVGPYDVAGKPFDVGDPRPLFNNLQPIYGGTVPAGTNMPPDTTYPRRSIYYELQAIYYADNPGVCLVQALGRHFSRGWVQKWYYNNLYPGFYYGHLYKQETHLGDGNRDGSVNVADLGWISGRWGATGLSPAGSTANVEGDINGGTGGTTGKLSGAAPGIPDGTVDVIDLSLVSAYWDTGPTGPSHP